MSKTTTFQTRNPDFAERVRDSFGRQGFMGFLGAEMTRVEPGFVEIRLEFRDQLGQQHGFFHGGVTGTLADNAAGYAAFTLFDADSSPLTVEYKLSLLAPARGTSMIARGQVIKPGSRLSVVRSDVFALGDGNETQCGAALVTIMRMAGMSDQRVA
ncbi:MAG: PaaI family thioesterase [Alphaproteobacteria bacterium]|nr:PaaI family thioesterase [Alphaproteobacteria bacterium]